MIFNQGTVLRFMKLDAKCYMIALFFLSAFWIYYWLCSCWGNVGVPNYWNILLDVSYEKLHFDSDTQIFRCL
ncbi:hypothetical protein L228DRAFT_57041 [Xylona heveae TC161]|uniref:Uncharacterized protein n=1 Tax=Xylona heveae (strain CBS 132557 / TC161) TaxID=1328760 RepID=A0A165IG06_XYLHT|nr:hypothetical protein L228DRAFT_57041 [Xylona heveae TC161]KZF24845.1 hypothetical protein L228DRAFT_57041 [Xylona heveae TC161]